MADDTLKVRNSRIFVQLEELVAYDLMQCSGLTTWNRPRGGLTPIREPSLTAIGEEVTASYQRASADMAGFTIQSRMKETANFMIELNCESNWQVLFKDCGDPTDYYGFQMGLAWVRCPPGDLSGEPLAVIEGDSVPIHIDQPFTAIYGPYIVDFTVEFLSGRTIAETGIVEDIAMFGEECQSDCAFAARNGQYGYLVSSAQAGSPVDAANVWFTEDDADTWALVSTNPFAAAEDISSVVKLGTVNNHRVVVSRGSTDAGAAAEIAYADVTVIGQTTWVNADVGTTVGEYINRLAWPVYNRMFAVSNLGRIYKSSDAGVTWAVEYLNAGGNELHDISYLRNGTGWVVGDGDLALLSEDWGNTWTAVTGPNDGAHNLNTCYVDLEGKIVVGDSNGGIFASVNKGTTWVTTPPQGVTATSVERIRGYHAHWMWCIVHIAATPPAEGNSRVLRSTDGGASWRLWTLTSNIVPNNGFYGMAVVDQNRCVIGGAPYPVGGTSFVSRTETSVDRIVT